jgi:hypothetical protein
MGDSEISDQSRRRELGHAMAAARSEPEGAEDPPAATQVGAEEETVGRARPLEFDRNGFPVAQRNPSFVTRVARLLNAP